MFSKTSVAKCNSTPAQSQEPPPHTAAPDPVQSAAIPISEAITENRVHFPKKKRGGRKPDEERLTVDYVKPSVGT
jgi:hypothetical protein